MIFRRRTTDQVYATLQQVQRRITESGPTGGSQPIGSGSPRPGAPVLRPGAGLQRTPVAFPTPAPEGPNALVMPLAPGSPVLTGPGTPTPAYGLPAQGASTQGGSSHGGGFSRPLDPPPASGVTVTPTLAVTMVLVWILTLLLVGTVAFMKGAGSQPAASTAPETATQAPAAADTSDAGNFYLVLIQVLKPDANAEAGAKRYADEFNRAATKHGGKPYFATHRPENGSVQLVFGSINGRLGVDRQKFVEFFRTIREPKSKGGLGYPGAFWVAVKEETR